MRDRRASVMIVAAALSACISPPKQDVNAGIKPVMACSPPAKPSVPSAGALDNQALYQFIKVHGQESIERGEFETEGQYKARLEGLQKPFVLTMPVEQVLSKSYSYDATSQKLQIFFKGNNSVTQSSVFQLPQTDPGFYVSSYNIYPVFQFREDKKTRNYVGRNALGAMADVEDITVDYYGLAVTNLKHSQFDEKEKYDSCWLNVTPNKGEQLVKSLVWRIHGHTQALGYPYARWVSQNKSWEVQRSLYSGATVASPTSVTAIYHFATVVVDRVELIDSKNGEVVHVFKY